MGRYAQARRRGSTPPGEGGIGPPPPPLLDGTPTFLTQTSRGGGDSGGYIDLWWVPYIGGPRHQVRDEEDWQPFFAWGNCEGEDPGFIYCTETGNGSDYEGESGPSNYVTVV